MSDLDQLREVGGRLRQPAFEDIVATRRRRTRHARVATGTALAGGLVVVATTLASLGQAERGTPEPIDRTPTPTPTETFVVPSGQETLVPEIGPSDVAGFEIVATLTSSQPEHRGDAELSVTIPDRSISMSTYCRGDAGLYAFTDIDDGGGGYFACSPDAPTTLAPTTDLVDQVAQDPVDGTRTVRMWLARPSREFLDCVEVDGPVDCPRAEDVPPVSDPDADFGFRLYGSPDVSPVLRLPLAEENGEPFRFRALISVGGVPWVLDRAVVAAPGASRLAVRVRASDRPRLVDVYADDSIHLERCRREHADDLPSYESVQSADYWAQVHRLCGVDVRLLVDGQRVPPSDDPRADGHVRPLGAVLDAAEHRIEVEVVRGDPRDVAYALVLRHRSEMP